MRQILFIFVIVLISSTLVQCDKDEQDETAPVITLLGSNPMSAPRDSAFIDPGYIATDNLDGDITDLVNVTGSVDVMTDGKYILKYNVIDASGNMAIEVERVVNVMVF